MTIWARVQSASGLKVVVEVPKNLNKEQKKILQEFEAATGDKQYQKRKSFFDKLKKGFNWAINPAVPSDSGILLYLLLLRNHPFAVHIRAEVWCLTGMDHRLETICKNFQKTIDFN